ncbi:hypothetical protein HJ588_18700 [Flexivirga sp. ID2601S]|uniref:Uncharacterized protein n=1 Tax=Flexivirga aerilata TaxID=1656889 RepID=A0A849AMA9_9MICO|nr:hypothetical protein [Flexivirga aerilata]NNG41293.1 hypothetical protein [Flexivirga aerilata]
MSASGRERFAGWITGIGTTSGVRVVIGQWPDSPFGAFSDVMLQDDGGVRTLLAPTAEIAEFISQTYVFDEVKVVTVTVGAVGRTCVLTAGELHLVWTIGARTLLGRLLSLPPRRVTTAPAWCRTADPAARLLMRGVRTAGSARDGRREFYGAFDQHAVTSAAGTWAGRSLGALRPVDRPVTFGFGSTPRRPSRTAVVTTVMPG